MSYIKKQKNLDIKAQNYCDSRNSPNTFLGRSILYSSSFVVSPFLTGFIMAKDILYEKPHYFVGVESREQSSGFLIDTRSGGILPNSEPKSPVIKSHRTNTKNLFMPYLYLSLVLGAGLSFVDSKISENLECTKLGEKTTIEGIGLENLINSCSYEMYKNIIK